MRFRQPLSRMSGGGWRSCFGNMVCGLPRHPIDDGQLKTDGCFYLMKESFRQSMAWLHSWLGLLAGWVLYFVFVTGTAGYANYEIDRWMQPELPLAVQESSLDKAIEQAANWLEEKAPEAATWYIIMPQSREGTFQLKWQDRPGNEGERGKFHEQIISHANGETLDIQPRDTGGGQLLYRMHYQLHYMPYQLGIAIVGLCTIAMLVAILSGLIVHAKIFKDFFTFRPRKGQRSWLDVHNLLSVTALPFHIMITWSGMILLLFSYMPVAVDVLYPGGHGAHEINETVYAYSDTEPANPKAKAAMASLIAMKESAQAEFGNAPVTHFDIYNPGRENALVYFYAAEGKAHRGGYYIPYSGVSGERLDGPEITRPGVGSFGAYLTGLHEGRFAGPFLRILFVLFGLAGAGMVATGLVHWTRKRASRRQKNSSGKTPFGERLVETLNIGTIIGLPSGLAVYLWANRLLPADLVGRAEMEVHAMFALWAVTFLWASARPAKRAWRELGILAGAMFALIPIINALMSDRHLGTTIPAGDWALASIDIFALIIGGIFFWVFARSKGQGTGHE